MADVSRGYISRLEAGDFTHPSAAFLLRIARALEINVEYLWEDIASVAPTREVQPTLSDLADQVAHVAQVVGQLRGLPLRQMHGAADGEGGRETQPRSSVPRLMLEDDHVPPRRWALQVDASVPQDYGLRRGDCVIVDPDLTPQHGQLVAIQSEGAVLIVPYEPLAVPAILGTAHPDYPTVEVPTVELLGVVCALVRELPAPPVSHLTADDVRGGALVAGFLSKG
jgi:hypothetical protein